MLLVRHWQRGRLSVRCRKTQPEEEQAQRLAGLGSGFRPRHVTRTRQVLLDPARALRFLSPFVHAPCSDTQHVQVRPRFYTWECDPTINIHKYDRYLIKSPSHDAPEPLGTKHIATPPYRPSRITAPLRLDQRRRRRRALHCHRVPPPRSRTTARRSAFGSEVAQTSIHSAASQPTHGGGGEAGSVVGGLRGGVVGVSDVAAGDGIEQAAIGDGNFCCGRDMIIRMMATAMEIQKLISSVDLA